MSERVTVIIPAWRCANTIGAAIESVLTQTEPCRVIVVDDASGDDTPDAARAAAGGSDRVEVLVQEVNQGPAAARNRALNTARTEWVALLDSDDRMQPDRIASLLKRAEAHGWDMIADDIIRLDDWSHPELGKRLWSDEDFDEIEIDLARFVRENIYTYCGHGRELGYLKPLMRRAALDAHHLRYDETMRLGEDFDLYARALAAGLRFGLVDAEGYLAFDTPGSLSKQHKAFDLKQVWRSSREIAALPGVHGAAQTMLKEHRLLSHKKWAWVRLIEAVKARRPIEAAACFAAPPEVIGELVDQLGGHLRRKLRVGRTRIRAGSAKKA